MNKKWNCEKIKYYIEIESNSGCKVVNINGDDGNCEVELICPCGNPFTTKFKYFKSKTNNKRQCDECGRKSSNESKMLNILEIEDYVINNSNCKLLTKEYTESLQLLEFECECGIPFKRTFPSFKTSLVKKCDECTLKNKRVTLNTSYEDAKEMFKKYKLKLVTSIENYFNLQQNLDLIDDEGYKYYTKYATVKQNGTACRFSKKNIYTIENIHLWLYKNNKEFLLISKKFIKAINKLVWKCKECNHEWNASWAQISTGCGCPECSLSKGEKICKEYFNLKNIYYMPQKEFDGLLGLGGGNLSYDFYIPKHNLLIEYQGEQHEKYIPGFHKSKKDFEKQVKHDKRKKNYAEQNKYNFLEIWYWEFDRIEEILTNYFSNLDNFNNKSEVIIN